jgi:hypothetical protein
MGAAGAGAAGGSGATSGAASPQQRVASAASRGGLRSAGTPGRAGGPL